MSLSTIFLYKKLLEKLLKTEGLANEIKEKNRKIDIEKLFKYLSNDKIYNEYLSLEDFKIFLTKYGILNTENELNTLMKRIDKSYDGRISLDSFRKGFCSDSK